MAARIKPLFSYGPLQVRQDDESRSLLVTHADKDASALVEEDDPLHKQILQTIDRNPYSKGFVANQVHALVDREDRWMGRGLDDEGLVLGPSREVEQQVEQKENLPSMEVTTIDLSSPEGKKLLAELEAEGIRLRDPAEYDPASSAIPQVAMDTANTLAKVQPALADPEADVSMRLQQRLLAPEEYQAQQYRQGVPQVGWDASAQIRQQLVTLAPETALESGDLPKQKEQQLAADSEPAPVRQEKFAAVEKPAAELEEPWPQAPEAKPLFPQEPRPVAQDSGQPKFERIRPPVILLDNGKGKPHVLDHGDKVTVTNRAMFGFSDSAKEKRRQAVEVALQAAAKRFGEPVHFQGSAKFMEETIAVAIQRGIKLEPGNEAAKRMYERALEKIEVNQLGPSKAAPYRAPEKSKEVSKGKGMEI